MSPKLASSDGKSDDTGIIYSSWSRNPAPFFCPGDSVEWIREESHQSWQFNDTSGIFWDILGKLFHNSLILRVRPYIWEWFPFWKKQWFQSSVATWGLTVSPPSIHDHLRLVPSGETHEEIAIGNGWRWPIHRWCNMYPPKMRSVKFDMACWK